MSDPRRWLLSRIQGQPDPGERRGRLMMLGGHYMLIPSAMWAAYSVGYAIAGSPDGRAVEWGQMFLFILTMTCFYCDLRWHGMRLCERCAALTPLDPQRAARRWKPALRVVHEMRERRKSLLVALVAFTLAPSFLPAGGWSTGLQVAGIVLILALWIAAWRHSRLQPWCPWCDWGRGGDEEVSPEVPDPALSK